MKTATGYGAHVLVSAIKYLDGTHNGHDGVCSEKQRKAAINVMLPLLSKRIQERLWKDRRAYWYGE